LLLLIALQKFPVNRGNFYFEAYFFHV